MNSRNFLSILALNILFCLTAVAQNQTERIISFHSDIVIETDGTIVVTDHEKVYAAGINIKRGILREIPLYRKDKNGRQVKMNFNVLSVTCNGENAKYSIENLGDELAIRIGDANVFLSPGEYDYVITYSSRGQIGFFDGYDELYWNVTGFSEFIIEQASASITLPGGVEATKTYAYTGKKDAQGQDYTVEDSGNVLVFTATRAFAPDEGLTVAVAFPPGIIERTEPIEDETSLPKATLIFFLVTLGILAILYLTAKRAKKHVVIPQFSPPNDWSPAVINYLLKKEYDRQAFAGTVVQLAVKGALVINKKDSLYELVNTSDVSRLNNEERIVHDSLFKGKDAEKIEMRSETAALIRANRALNKEMVDGYKLKEYYTKNKTRLIWGLVVIILLPMLYSIVAQEDYINAAIVGLPFLILSVCAMFFKGNKAPLIGVSIIVAVISILLALFGVPFEEDFPDYLALIPTLYFIATGILYTGYAFTLYRPTEKGAQALADINGLLMYMKTAEQHRLNLLNPPDQTPEHFEKLLPYAMALDVANEWCSRFATRLAAAQYQPSWNNETFDDRKWRNFHSSFAQPFRTSVSIAVISSSSSSSGSGSSGSSSWSSGSSGGGRSGGGGGGGRTRGW